MRRVIGIILLVGVLVVVVHDAAKYATAQRHLRAVTYDVTQWAGLSAKEWSREQAASEVAQKAATQGVTIYQFGKTETMVQLWGRYQVSGTWVLGPAVNLTKGMKFEDAKSAPLEITVYRESRFM